MASVSPPWNIVMRLCVLPVLLTFIIFGSASPVAAGDQEWFRFRGPNRSLTVGRVETASRQAGKQELVRSRPTGRSQIELLIKPFS